MKRRVDDLKAKIIQVPKEKMSKPTALPRPLQLNTWSPLVMYSFLFNFHH